MLFKLKKIKAIREQRAQKDKTLKLQEKRQAEGVLSDAKSQLSQYLKWQQQEIEKRYQAILGKNLHLDNLTNLNYDIATYKARQQTLEQKVEQARAYLQDSISALAAAEKALSEARSQLEKFDQLTQHEQARQQQAGRLQDDSALDEFVGKGRAIFGPGCQV